MRRDKGHPIHRTRYRLLTRPLFYTKLKAGKCLTHIGREGQTHHPRGVDAGDLLDFISGQPYLSDALALWHCW